MIVGILGHSGVGKDTMAEYLGVTHRLVKVALADPMKRFCQKIFGFTTQQLWGDSDSRNAPDSRYGFGEDALSVAQGALQRMWTHGPSFIDEVLPLLPLAYKRKALVSLWDWFDKCLAQPGLSARFALQTLGTEWGREVYADVWAKHAFEVIIPGIMSHKFLYSQERGLIPLGILGRFTVTVLGPPKGVVISDMRFPNEIGLGRKHDCYTVRLRRAGKDGTIKGGVENHRSETLQKLIPDAAVDAVLGVPEGLPKYYRAIDSLVERMPRPKRRARLTV